MICCQIHDNGDSDLETQATGNRVSKIIYLMSYMSYVLV